MADKQAEAQRYAQAVYQAMLERWHSALDQVQAVLSEDRDLYSLVMDRSKDFDKRAKALEGALPAELPVEIINLLKLMLQEDDLDMLPEVADALSRVGSTAAAPVKAEIISASELSEKDKEALRANLTKQFGTNLIFSFHVDPSLMGGLRVRVGDRLMDTSIASRLAALRESLTSVVR